MLHVGLTGGMASGKSTVAALFSELGASVLSADQIAREVVAPGTPGLDAVVAAFGREVLLPGGGLDREAMAHLVFDDDAALAEMNGILHPLIREETAARVAGMRDDAVVVHDVPLLVENDMGAQYHLVVVVGASVATRIARAVARGMAEPQVVARIAVQADDAARRSAADVWVENEGSEAGLQRVVELLWRARVVPFAENLLEGRWAEPGELGDAPDTRRGWTDQAERLAARLERAVAGATSRPTMVPPVDEAPLDVLELRARLAGTEVPDLRPAGFVPMETGVWANADPGRPAVLRLER